VKLRDGTVVIRVCDAPAGSWRRPVQPKAIEDKARGLLQGAVGPARTDRLMDALCRAPEHLATRDLMAALRAGPGAA
jgi:hypothetical protein